VKNVTAGANPMAIKRGIGKAVDAIVVGSRRKSGDDSKGMVGHSILPVADRRRRSSLCY
jgi:hypothetical protein